VVIVYCDTSFLLSFFYEQDSNHANARREMDRRYADDLVLCEVHFLEFPAAVRAATFRETSRILPYEARKILSRFDRATLGSVFVRKSVNFSDSVTMARSLGEAHGCKQRHTPFDLWHLAAAWSLSADAFLTFDKRQAPVARKLGMA
jgi:predicted nucleic acid-binding protein